MTPPPMTTTRAWDGTAVTMTPGGVASSEFREPAEVPIGGEEFRHPVPKTECRDSCIVDTRSGNATGFQLLAQGSPVAVVLPDESQGRGLHPRLDLVARLWQGRWRGKDAWMRDDGEELVEAWPWDPPAPPSLGELGERQARRPMKFRIHTVRLDEDIRIDGDHPPPRPS